MNITKLNDRVKKIDNKYTKLQDNKKPTVEITEKLLTSIYRLHSAQYKSDKKKFLSLVTGLKYVFKEPKMSKTPRKKVVKAKSPIPIVEEFHQSESSVAAMVSEFHYGEQEINQINEEKDVIQESVQVLTVLYDTLVENTEDIEQQSDFLIKGKRLPTQKSEQKNKRIKSINTVDNHLSRVGFKKSVNKHVGITTYSRSIPEDMTNTIKSRLQYLVLDSFFDDMKGSFGTDHTIQQQRKTNEINREFSSMYRLIKPLENQLKKLRNTKLVYKYSDNYDQQDQTVITENNFIDFITKIIKHIRKYKTGTDFDENIRLRRYTDQIEKLEISLLVSKEIPPKTTKGQFIRDIVKSSWFVINPNTKTHCVADCLAIVQTFRSDKQLTSLWGYIKEVGKQIVSQYGINDGCEVQKLKQLSQHFNVDIVFDLYEDKEMLDRDCYLIVQDGHCYIALNPENPRSQQFYDMSERFNQEQQKLMSKWKPKDKLIFLVSWDFEWVVKETQQIPYAFGMYTDYEGIQMCESDAKYLQFLQHENIYQSFCNSLYDTAYKFFNNNRSELFTINKADNSETRNKQRITISFVAHSGHKADYPIIEKALLNDSRFILVGQCASGMAKISYTYKIDDSNEIYIQFVDSTNFFQCSLDQMGKTMGLSVQKQDVKHNLINFENYKQQIIDQKIDYYLRCDCQVLYDSMIKYDEIIQSQVGFSIIKNNILTNASLAEKIYFSTNYNDNIYKMTSSMQEYCQRAYYGGMTDNFARGEFKNVISLDINSSYPFQMIKKPFPVGKYYMRVLNYQYKRQPLEEGIYRVIVKYTPKLRFPVLCDTIDGKLSFRIFKKHQLYITKETLVFAYERGYQLHLLDCLVSENVADIYGKYINEAYAKRKEYKKLMQNAQSTEDYCRYDLLQSIEKLKMNSTYGKMGWAEKHDVSAFITSDSKFLLEQFACGNITEIKQINERYSQYSGVQSSATNKTNFMIASYITARGRMQLIEALENIEKAGYLAIYSDTDSIYACPTENFSKELYDKYISPMIDNVNLGGFKLEMKDNVDEDTATGVFVAPKLYALKGEQTKIEKIKARGIMAWMIGDKQENINRRLHEGAKQVTYDDVKNLLKNIPIEITRQQQFIQKKLLTDPTADNIKVQKQCTSLVTGQITKKAVTASGRCNPLVFCGDVEIPIKQNSEDDWIQFSKIQDIEQYFDKSFSEIADSHCVIRNQVANVYIVFLNDDSIEKYLHDNNQEFVCHQMFGDWIMPTFDIDIKKNDQQGVDLNIQSTVEKLLNMLNLDNTVNVSLVDRSREDKISYHIRFPDYCVKRKELSILVNKLVEADIKLDNPTMISFVDSCIYREKGSLRISDNSIYYRCGLKQINIICDKMIQRINNKKIKDSPISAQTEATIKEKVNKYLQEQKLNGWSFRNAKLFKTYTVAYLNRSREAKSHCDICNKTHDKDNFLYLRMTATKVTKHCLKFKQQL